MRAQKPKRKKERRAQLEHGRHGRRDDLLLSHGTSSVAGTQPAAVGPLSFSGLFCFKDCICRPCLLFSAIFAKVRWIYDGVRPPDWCAAGKSPVLCSCNPFEGSPRCC